MKQLLIVNSAAKANGGVSTPKDLTNMEKGGIGFYYLNDDSEWLSSAIDFKQNFAIVLGRGSNSNPIIIPEVDAKTLSIVHTEYAAGKQFSADITIPTIVPGNTYTLVLVKNGTVPHERNTWTATHTVDAKDTTATAASVAKILCDYFKNMAATGSINITATVASAKITIKGNTIGEQWSLIGGNALYNTTINTTVAEPTIGDKAYVQDLASRCAAGKGFTDVYADGESIYPGYPEDVENANYDIFTLRFAVGRDSAKTRDERVSQLVHVAVPSTSSSLSTIKTILGLSTILASNQ